MSKVAHRKAALEGIQRGIFATKEAIAQQRTQLANLEDKLESKRAEMQKQLLLLKFDEIDELRQEMANAMATGHIDELEANDKLKS